MTRADVRSCRVAKSTSWILCVGSNDQRMPDLLQILDGEERERAVQFAFERERRHFIKSHAMVRQILATYGDADAASLRFARGAHGKPYLIAPVSGPDIQFSLSHSGDLCVLAIQRGHPISSTWRRCAISPRARSSRKTISRPQKAGGWGLRI